MESNILRTFEHQIITSLCEILENGIFLIIIGETVSVVAQCDEQVLERVITRVAEETA